MRKSQKLDVSFIQDRFGRFVEDHPILMRRLGNFESFLLRDKLVDQQIDRPVFISGLARSGSTILLEMLASHPMVVTHRYRDFPFVHLPYGWNWFLERAKKDDPEAVERFHQDGIMITPESPEAMEEMLWMSFFPACHDPEQSGVMSAETEEPEFERFYTDHIRKMLLLRGGRRYVAKCNYHVNRLPYLKKILGGVRFIIPVREPLAHVDSLVRQHRLFCEAESQNRKIQDYMRRVGHFEFGLDRRPIHVGDSERTTQCLSLWANNQDAEGYACQWASIYEWIVKLLETDPEMEDSIFLVLLEDFYRNPVEILDALYRFCELDIAQDQVIKEAERVKTSSYKPVFSTTEKRFIKEQTHSIYDRILSHCQHP